jgi:hypothetical protein
MIAVSVFVIVYAWNEFLFAFIFTTIRAKTAPLVIAEMIGAVEGVEWGVLFAASTVQLLPVLLFVVLAQKHLVPASPPAQPRGSPMPDALDFRRALLDTQPGLSRFDPLPRIIAYDDFDRGFCGWTQLVGNYEGSLDTMLPGYAQHSQAMLSSVSHWDAGSHGSVDGSYALKLPTQARRGAQNVTIKRLTFRKRGPVRLEAYFTLKPEATELRLSETDVRSVGLLFDLQSGDQDSDALRVMPHLRFLNALDGEHVQKWQFKTKTTPMKPLGTENKTLTHYHLSPNDWEDLPGGAEKLCYNEIPTKINWHYLRFDFDLATWKAMNFFCNDREFDVTGFDSIRIPGMRNLWCMLNIAFFVEADVDKRAFLYLDSVCLSGDF